MKGNNHMARANGRINGFVKDSLEQAQDRLETLEKEASKMLEEVRERSKASRKEMTELIARFQRGEMFESAKVKEKELVKSAEKVGGELTKRLQVIQQSVLGFVGVASKDQVEEVIAELEKLARRLDKLARSGRANPKKKSRDAGLDA
jgi:hypothetical protein